MTVQLWQKQHLHCITRNGADRWQAALSESRAIRQLQPTNLVAQTKTLLSFLLTETLTFLLQFNGRAAKCLRNDAQRQITTRRLIPMRRLQSTCGGWEWPRELSWVEFIWRKLRISKTRKEPYQLQKPQGHRKNRKGIESLPLDWSIKVHSKPNLHRIG